MMALLWQPCIHLAANGQPAGKQDPGPPASDDALTKLMDEVRAAEKKFASLETVAKKSRFKPGDTAQIKRPSHRVKSFAIPAIHEDAVTRTVVQGDRVYVKTSISRRGGKGRTINVERVSAFDGKKTLTVEVGSAVNIHDGRTILTRVLPPQSWPLGIDVPLSKFLMGPDSADEPPRAPVDSILPDNPPPPACAIDAHIAGEESVNGLACIRLEYEQEEPADGSRSLVWLWLAKDRHLIPVKQQVRKDSDAGPVMLRESRVEEWLDVENQLWLPKRIFLFTYEADAAKKRKESRRETVLLDKASLRPNYPPEFFSKIGFAAGLPVFKIKQGLLEGSLPFPDKPGDEEGRLKKIADQLRNEESRYDRLLVNATEIRTTNPLFGDINKKRTTKMHSLLEKEMAYTDAHHETVHFDGSLRPMDWTEGFDGQTYRAFGRHPPPQPGGYAWVSSSNFFQRNITLVPVMLRPHSALVPWASSYCRLTDLLWPAAGAKPLVPKWTVDYLGEAPCGLFDCHVVAVRLAANVAQGPRCLLWLAKDRNLIPVRLEEYQGEQTLPVRLDVVDTFHQAAADVWYPAHTMRYIFRRRIPPAVRAGFLFVDQTWDYTVQRVSLDPTPPAGIFGHVPVYENIDVQYFDKSGKFMGIRRQSEETIPEMPPGK
jgi:hypothetical protein